MQHDNVHEIRIVSLLYVSRSTLEEHKAQEEISDIVSIARSRNSDLNVTGALLYTGAHFAQILEGPQRAVYELMGSIKSDARHTDVTTVEIKQITAKKFPDWAMVCSGPSPFLDRHIKPLISPLTPKATREELITSLHETFILVSHPQQR